MGEMAEWFMAPVLKTNIVSKTIEGSNPSLSFSHFMDKYSFFWINIIHKRDYIYIYEIEWLGQMTEPL